MNKLNTVQAFPNQTPSRHHDGQKRSFDVQGAKKKKTQVGKRVSMQPELRGKPHCVPPGTFHESKGLEEDRGFGAQINPISLPPPGQSPKNCLVASPAHVCQPAITTAEGQSDSPACQPYSSLQRCSQSQIFLPLIASGSPRCTIARTPDSHKLSLYSTHQLPAQSPAKTAFSAPLSQCSRQLEHAVIWPVRNRVRSGAVTGVRHPSTKPVMAPRDIAGHSVFSRALMGTGRNTECTHIYTIRFGATAAERFACSPPTKVIRAQSPVGSLRIFACENRAGRCHWSAGFLGDLLLPPPFHSCAAPFLPQSPTSALKTSMLNAAAGIAWKRMEGARVREAELVASSSHQKALGRARSAARLSSVRKMRYIWVQASSATSSTNEECLLPPDNHVVVSGPDGRRSIVRTSPESELVGHQVSRGAVLMELTSSTSKHTPVCHPLPPYLSELVRLHDASHPLPPLPSEVLEVSHPDCLRMSIFATDSTWRQLDTGVQMAPEVPAPHPTSHLHLLSRET
ncbi:hypothetical protein PR048_027420 [Dryococelus australis]|uniref:Uncharacterized protein n=1 Tax=Dryococelus australis TaxID=614101 RepID=A0ABQ9GFE5_9NEOP|nr:hypothetical protein PR048_027420 [Dryococelus australis]